jgi:hypothetical protein
MPATPVGENPFILVGRATAPGGTGPTVLIYRKVCVGSEGGQTYLFEGDNSLGASSITFALDHVDASQPEDVVSADGTGSSTSPQAPATTATRRNDVIIQFTAAAASDVTPAPGFVEILERDNSPDATQVGTMQMAWRYQATDGAIAAATETLNTSAPWATIQVGVSEGNVAPTVAITSPTDGDTVTADVVTVTATASDRDGIQAVSVRVGGQGTWLAMPLVGPGIYSRDVQVPSVAGQVVADLIEVRAKDSNRSPLTSIAQITLLVDKTGSGSGGNGGGGGEVGVAFTKTKYLGVESYAAMHDRLAALQHYVEGVAPLPTMNKTQALIALKAIENTTVDFSVLVQPGFAYVQGDDVALQGLYEDFNDSLERVVNDLGAPAAATRIDLLVARVNDEEHTTRTPTGGMFFDWVHGTEGGAEPAAPPTALVIAAVTIPTSATGITNSMIADRRKPYGIGLWGSDGTRYRLGVDANSELGLEAVT